MIATNTTTARYYDYDYDNNRIIMFDADEIEVSLDILDLEADPSHQVSQSTETVPDDPILGALSNPNDKIDESKSSPSVEATEEKMRLKIQDEDEEDQGVMWISSESPKGTRHIPYALQFTHSYAINKLEATLTQLVDTKTVQRQKQQRQQAQQQQAMALRAKWMQQQQLRYKHGAVPHGQHAQDPRYAHPQPHPHAHYRAPYPAPPHAQDPRYAHYRGHPSHPSHASHPGAAAAAAYGRSHAAQQAPPVSGSRKDPSAHTGSPSQSPYMAHARVHPNHPAHAYHGHQQPAMAIAGNTVDTNKATQNKAM